MLKKRYILVNKSDVTSAIDIINEVKGSHTLIVSALMDWMEFTVGCCGWAKAPDCWFMHFVATNKDWHRIMMLFNQYGIKILPETTGR